MPQWLCTACGSLRLRSKFRCHRNCKDASHSLSRATHEDNPLALPVQQCCLTKAGGHAAGKSLAVFAASSSCSTCFLRHTFRSQRCRAALRLWMLTPVSPGKGCDEQYALDCEITENPVGTSRNWFAHATAQQRDNTQHSRSASLCEDCGCHHADQLDVLIFTAGAIVLCCFWDVAMPGSNR